MISLLTAALLLAADPNTTTLIDLSRNRPIPIAIYEPTPVPGRKLRPAILSHGYGLKNTDYSFLASHLASQGYYVVSLQHEIPGDAPLPTTGDLYQLRMSSWQYGVQSILAVIEQLRVTQPGLDFPRLLLIGHSHGGDTSVLFAREYPQRLHALITLDHRRMPLPLTSTPRVLTLRSSDQSADPGAIPERPDQLRFRIKVTPTSTPHNDMCDTAAPAQKAEILSQIDNFLANLR